MRQLLTTNYSLRTKRGIASLPAILLFGSILIEIGIAGAFLVYYLNNSVYGTRLTNEAIVIAQTGIDDALLRIVLDKTCPNATCLAEYTLTIGRGTASVTICKDTCAGVGKDQITVIGRALTKQRQLIAIVSVDATTGLVTVDSLQDSAL